MPVAAPLSPLRGSRRVLEECPAIRAEC